MGTKQVINWQDQHFNQKGRHVWEAETQVDRGRQWLSSFILSTCVRDCVVYVRDAHGGSAVLSAPELKPLPAVTHCADSETEMPGYTGLSPLSAVAAQSSWAREAVVLGWAICSLLISLLTLSHTDTPQNTHTLTSLHTCLHIHTNTHTHIHTLTSLHTCSIHTHIHTHIFS